VVAVAPTVPLPMPFTTNLHTHTFRCQHASGDASDYARVAAKAGMSVLGMSDHTPLPDGRWPDMRMALSELDEYEAAIALARSEFPQLRILIGLECEFALEYEAFYRDEILGRRGYDYLIAGCHYTPLGGDWIPSFGGLDSARTLRAYADYTIRSMASELFAFVTHPDLIGCSHQAWTTDTAACARDICQAAATLGVPLEINSYGVRKPWMNTSTGPRPAYPWLPFWETAADMGVSVVLSSDAHRPIDTAAGYQEVSAIRDLFKLHEADLSYLTHPGTQAHVN
jgi:histidinol-phosphatase (PHP family)